MRRDYCPTCTVSVEIRSNLPPYATFPGVGYLAFVVHGERFAVTLVPGITKSQPFRVSHVATGCAVPNTDACTKELAQQVGREFLESLTPEKLQASLAKVRALISK